MTFLRRKDVAQNGWRMAPWFAAALFLLYVATFANYATAGGLRLTRPAYNDNLSNANFLLPIAILVLLAFAPRSRGKTWALFGSSAVAALSLVLGFAAFCFGSRGSITTVKIIPVPHNPVCIYHEYGLILDDFGTMEVKQEFYILPGLNWVTSLCYNDAEYISVQLIDKHHLYCIFSNRDGDRQPNPREVTLAFR